MKEAEDFAEKELKAIKEQLDKDFIEQAIFGIPVGYRIDKDGNFNKLTQEELWDLKSRDKKLKTNE